MLDEDERPASVPLRDVLSVLPADLSQRQDRRSNPHGEHAHDVWTLLEAPSPAVLRASPRARKVQQQTE